MKIIKDYYKLKDNIRIEFIKYFYQDEEGEKDIYIDYLDDRDIYWIGNWNILAIADAFFSLEDIVYTLENSVDRWILLDWYWETLEDHINLPIYIKMRWDGTHDDYKTFQEAQEKLRNDPEHQKKVEAELKKIWDDGMKNIEKYITKNKWTSPTVQSPTLLK